MNFVLFYHSLESDWNHGNAHFLRGIVSELKSRGHRVNVFEPLNGWSRTNLIKYHGRQPIEAFKKCYPELTSIFYPPENLDLDAATDDADIVIVHEWNEPWLVNGLGKLRREGARFRLLFHDTHHRAISEPEWLERFEFDDYDGVLAFGEVLREIYHRRGWHDQVWVWHEAADTRVFHPRQHSEYLPRNDVVWIGNWGDNERSKTLEQFLFEPVEDLKLKTQLYGVRYPLTVLNQLQERNIQYCGWLPNFYVPEVFSRHKLTIHIPRRFYTEKLPGIPTIRPFEAMACAIPLICAPWDDTERLFTPGRDYLVARNGREMRNHINHLIHDPDYATQLSLDALNTILQRHTCAHRVDQLLNDICSTLGPEQKPETELPPGRSAYAL